MLDGVNLLDIQYNIAEWHFTWAELGFQLRVLEVLTPGILQIDCPATGYSEPISIDSPGLYELNLGGMILEEPQLFALTLDVTSGAEFSIDFLGVPSLVPLSSVGDDGVPAVLALAVSYPNPFNPQTTIKFTVPNSADVELAVFDLKGHLVKMLLQGPLPAGDYSEVWRGRDGDGREVPSGVYLCRLQVGELIRSTKMTLMR